MDILKIKPMIKFDSHISHSLAILTILALYFPGVELCNFNYTKESIIVLLVLNIIVLEKKIPFSVVNSAIVWGIILLHMIGYLPPEYDDHIVRRQDVCFEWYAEGKCSNCAYFPDDCVACVFKHVLIPKEHADKYVRLACICACATLVNVCNVLVLMLNNL